LEAEAMIWRGMLEDSLDTLSIRKSVFDDPESVIRSLSLAGVALSHLQRFPEADSKLSAAEGMCSRSELVVCGEVIRARGVLAVERSKYDEARLFYLEDLKFAQARNDQAMKSTALLNLGYVDLVTYHLDESIDWSWSAYKAGVELGDENQIQGALGNLGAAYRGLGDTERASEMFLQAEDRAAKLGNIRDQLKWHMNVGDVYFDGAKYPLARQSYEQALQLARRINSRDDITQAVLRMGQLALAEGRPDEASSFAAQALSISQKTGSRPDMMDAKAVQMQVAAIRGDKLRAEQLLREVQADPDSELSMKWASELAMAQMYESAGGFPAAQAEYLTALSTFECARSQVTSESSRLPFMANGSRVYDNYLHFLVKQGKDNEALVAADQSRARTLAQGLGGAECKEKTFTPVAVNPTGIAKKAGATILYYWMGEKQSYLWAITAEKTTMFTLPAQREITPLAERYREVLRGSQDPLEKGLGANRTGVALYSMLVAPAEEAIRGSAGKPVMILADGALCELNFETLVVPAKEAGAKSHYWIEDETVISAPSLAMLAAAKPMRAETKRLLLLGDAVSPNKDFPDLPYAAREMKDVAGHFAPANATVFAQQRANPTTYLTSSPQQFSYIHFVSHGVASRTDPLDSAIILSRTAGDENSFKLHAREIMQHTIDARLVTISACSGTGTRYYVGEGLVGLSWAFLRAGAHNAIGALWEVADESTPQLMDTLYSGLDAGQTPAAALRNAKLDLLHSNGKFRRPFYWAPFQIYTRL
jgi:CHAT domain-containing protein